MNAIDCISPSNRWTDRVNKSRDWYLFETLCQLPTKQLNGMASSGRIPI